MKRRPRRCSRMIPERSMPLLNRRSSCSNPSESRSSTRMRLIHPFAMTGAIEAAGRRHVRSQKRYHPRRSAADHAEYTTVTRQRAERAGARSDALMPRVRGEMMTSSPTMAGIAVYPGRAGSIHRTTLPVPSPGPGEALVRVRRVGVCGTDQEIIHGQFGTPPPGMDELILGHEVFGEVEALGPGADG